MFFSFRRQILLFINGIFLFPCVLLAMQGAGTRVYGLPHLESEVTWQLAADQNAPATQAAQAAVVPELLQNRVALFQTIMRAANPIQAALATGDRDLVGLVLSRMNGQQEALVQATGADLDLRMASSFSPLYSAVEGGNPAVVRLCVDAGADHAYGGLVGLSPLWRAVELLQRDNAHFLVSQGASPDIDVVTSSGISMPMIFAVLSGHEPVLAPGRVLTVSQQEADLFRLKLLCELGVSVDRTYQDYSPLDMAASCGQKFVALILERAQEQLVLETLIETSTHAVQEAFENNDHALLTLLFKAGFPVYGEYLFQAVRLGDKNLVHILLDAGAPINEKDEKQITPLHHAVSAGRLDIVNLLLAAGADPLLTDDQQCTAIELADLKLRWAKTEAEESLYEKIQQALVAAHEKMKASAH
jgi:ankyrin repeat protein